MQKRNWGSLLATTLFVIVFPGLSWYYLQKGATYRINALKELKQDLGKIDSFSCQPANWKFINQDTVDGRITIVNIVKYKGELSELQSETAQKLHFQFGERQDIVFLTLLDGADSLQAYTYYKGQNLKRSNKSYFVIPADAALKTKWIQTFKFAQKGDFSHAECPYYAYIDLDGTVRSFYDVKNVDEIKKMVEHIAMKIFDKKENPRLTRELEK
jgi:hypothetical protein